MKRRLFYSLLSVAGLVFWCEFLIYYVVLLRCHWPDLIGDNVDPYVRIVAPIAPSRDESHVRDAVGGGGGLSPSGSSFDAVKPLKVMLLADTHLLGLRQGHWFDKMRREWQMERAFQSAMFIHSPDVVFFLGDVFDEGKWASQEEFEMYVKRFQEMFRHWVTHTKVKVIMGNHDVGFHYDMSRPKLKRMQVHLNATASVMLWSPAPHNVHFVSLNSMSLHGDNCSLCRTAVHRINTIAHQLACLRGDDLGQLSDCGDSDILRDSAGNVAMYSRPILLQHFPLFRKDDSDCPPDIDAAPSSEKYERMREQWDTLSQQSSQLLLEKLKPRLVFDGHTHFSCIRQHVLADSVTKVLEYTVPSFSWRNINSPSFLLLKVTSNNHALMKCFLPQENTVITTYCLVGFAILLCTLWPFLAVVLHKTLLRKLFSAFHKTK